MDDMLTSQTSYAQVIEWICCETQRDFAYYSCVEAPASVSLAAFMFNKSIEEVISDCKMLYELESE